MIQKITIQNIYQNEAKKDGTPYVDRNGKKFKLVTVIPVNGERMSMCDYRGETAEWHEGMEVEVAIERNGDFLNFNPPSRLDRLELRIAALEASRTQGSDMAVKTQKQEAEKIFTQDPEANGYVPVVEDDLPF